MCCLANYGLFLSLITELRLMYEVAPNLQLSKLIILEIKVYCC